MVRSSARSGVLVELSILLGATPAHATSSFPIVSLGWSAMFHALIPIVLFEWIIVSQVTGFPGTALIAVGAANLASTVAGVALLLFVDLLAMGIVSASHYWGTEEHKVDGDRFLAWERFRMLPLWGLMMLIPFFLLSWWLEVEVAGWFLGGLPRSVLNTVIFDANLVTYCMLALLVTGFLNGIVMARRGVALSTKDRAQIAASNAIGVAHNTLDAPKGDNVIAFNR